MKIIVFQYIPQSVVRTSWQMLAFRLYNKFTKFIAGSSFIVIMRQAGVTAAPAAW